MNSSEKQLAKSDKKMLGAKFERLTIVKRVNETGRATYLCKCDCGNEVVVKGNQLTSGKVKSCGCLKKEVSRKSFEKVRERGIEKVKEVSVESTNLLSLKQKVSKNNKTGVKGVQLMKNGKYRAVINFQREQIHLGVYGSLEEAAEARRSAEEKYFAPLLEKYDK